MKGLTSLSFIFTLFATSAALPALIIPNELSLTIPANNTPVSLTTACYGVVDTNPAGSGFILVLSFDLTFPNGSVSASGPMGSEACLDTGVSTSFRFADLMHVGLYTLLTTVEVRVPSNAGNPLASCSSPFRDEFTYLYNSWTIVPPETVVSPPSELTTIEALAADTSTATPLSIHTGTYGYSP
ncbi:hypothetical protein RQP46_002714 [Phenoliferia psychrophenolica]